MPLPEEKNAHVEHYEDHDSPVARQPGVALRGCFFLLEDRVHLVAHTSPAERGLREQGAIHFADVSFDPAPTPDPADRAPVLRPVGARRAAEALRSMLNRN